MEFNNESLIETYENVLDVKYNYTDFINFIMSLISKSNFI